MNNRHFLSVALAAVFLAASPPTNACTMTRTGLPDDHVAQYTEQIDKNVNMVALRDADADRLVIPIVNRESYQIVAAGDYNAQILIFDDHPRAVSDHALYNGRSNWTYRDPASSAAMHAMLIRPSWNKLAYNGSNYQDNGMINTTARKTELVKTQRLVRLSRT